ncbi:UPF0061-domain-containing protein [Trametopsis cervina]|nr:UPF0061-domain-containing protein [Trametopsis cervina]
MSTSSKLPLGSLPLPPATHTLTKNLTPDPLATSPKEFNKLQHERPSLQRRARLVDRNAHFSYVAPCPLPFPFRIAPEEGEEVTDKSAFIEQWLSTREALAGEEGDIQRPSGLHSFYPAKRDESRELLALSDTCLQDCLPHLDVGDAFDILGTPRLSKAEEQNQETPRPDSAARKELIDVLSGHATLMNISEDANESWAPWSLRYSGHQFGNWAGQLGDGRAISILATPHPSNPDLVYELQLKGAGRTPFSRSADGLAIVRASIREFLCAEAMNALSIPTSRSLALIELASIPVLRERLERACVVSRIAPSFIRVGSFEALNPPALTYNWGGGQQESSWEALRLLGEWVGRRVLQLQGVKWREDGQDGDGDAWGKKLVLESAKRNAKMVAGWQAYGFMHGVINTDNVSIMGLTIDYGPYAFMDIFNPYHICNHDDGEGRYNYQNQPQVVLFAMHALLNSLAPLVGAEIARGNKAVPPGWAADATEETIEEWEKAGTEDMLDAINDIFQTTCAEEYRRLMHKRLALRRTHPSDETKLNRPLLSILSDHSLDFHSTFRRLSYFRPSLLTSTNPDGKNPELDAYISSLLALTTDEKLVDEIKARQDWKAWLNAYAERIHSERDLWGTEGISVDEERQKAMREGNPRFVLRQWVLEEVIKVVEEDTERGRRVLGKVLKMATNPFAPWGGEDDPASTEALDEEILEERRLCGIGEKRMLGFQCSCSS